jgi:AbrB family looped-hinge helix DNA binding protein
VNVRIKLDILTLFPKFGIMKTTIIRKKGQITIPMKIRKALGLEENDVVTITLMGDKAIMITPGKSKLDELLDKTANMAKEKGITLEDMLLELDKVRHNK